MKLHIVQLISPLSLPNRPVLFIDQAAAEDYFVQLVQENYGTSYPEFCDQEGFDGDDYSSALAFKETLEPDENEIQYWTTDLQLAGAKGQLYSFTLDALSFKRQRELVLELTAEAEPEKFSSSRHQVLDGLTNLLDAIADQAHDVYGLDVLFTDAQCDDRDAEADYSPYPYSDLHPILDQTNAYFFEHNLPLEVELRNAGVITDLDHVDTPMGAGFVVEFGSWEAGTAFIDRLNAHYEK